MDSSTSTCLPSGGSSCSLESSRWKKESENTDSQIIEKACRVSYCSSSWVSFHGKWILWYSLWMNELLRTLIPLINITRLEGNGLCPVLDMFLCREVCVIKLIEDEVLLRFTFGKNCSLLVVADGIVHFWFPWFVIVITAEWACKIRNAKDPVRKVFPSVVIHSQHAREISKSKFWCCITDRDVRSRLCLDLCLDYMSEASFIFLHIK